ncbi:hypothetical protein Lalb_Chr08g0240981 [Lupinus albus]|uniref:Uncharacterized protein n=1 Tax=Lupinus albus TaxID=3870 RepID=A0A6A4Q5X2_LUPAL|nr:hypothetical protein Lalb_Chr08g0240981 [Lupinus albus]
MLQKRVRSNSPVNLTRQKSFRKHYTNSTTCLTPDVKDFDRSKNIGESHIIVGQLSQKEAERSNIPSRMLGSPSPSRKSNINGDKYCGSAKNSVSKSMINAPKVNAAHSSHCVLSSLRKESVKAANPNNSSRRFHNGLKHREIFIANKLGSDETVGSNHNMDSIMEDINNPLISLDCFIFL